MKTSWMVEVALVFTACGVLAQGTFNFGNKNTIVSPRIDARVMVGLPGEMGLVGDMVPAAGTDYWAQALVRLAGDPDSSYAPVGTAVHFRTGNNARYIVTTTVTTPYPDGSRVAVLMYVWPAALGDSYEEAIENSLPGDFWPCRGRSGGEVLLTVAEAPNLPQDMIGLQSFWIGPMCCWPSAGIVTQPTGVRVPVSSSARLEARVEGCPVFVQWYRDGQPVPGATTRILRIASARLADTGDYHLTVTDTRSSATSDTARVVVGYPLTLTTNGPGRVEVQPAFEIFEPGQQVQLTAVATEGAVFEGWDGDLSGTTNPTALTINGPKAVRAWFSRVPLRLGISWQQGKVQLDWTPPAVLQVSEALAPGNWQDKSEAASPYEVEPANAQRFYRLRRPRQTRCVRLGGEPREPWQANGLGPRLRWRPPFRRRERREGRGRGCSPAPPAVPVGHTDCDADARVVRRRERQL